MTLGQQILWGGFYMGVCLMLETAILVSATSVLRRADRWLERGSRPMIAGSLMLLTLLFILLAHTVQILIWSGALMRNGASADWNEAVYFSLVTYTTVGYGDLTLGPELRVFGTFAGMAGVLSFGLSSAFLVAVTSRLLQEKIFGPR